MALENYGDLKASIASWLDRDDMENIIPDLIRIVEEDLNARLRRDVVRGALALNAAVVDLPSDCEELRSVRLNTSTYKHVLEQMGPAQIADYRAEATGVPYRYSVVDGQLLLDPAPDVSYDAELTYFARLEPLEADGDVNSVLTNAPSLYLYGALSHAEGFIGNDERIAVWQSRYDSAIVREEIARERREVGASPAPMRLPRVFG